MSNPLSDPTFWAILIVVLAVLIFESIITTRGLKNQVYLSYIKPTIQPPGFIFSIAWLILFGIIIYSWWSSLNNAINHNNTTYIILINVFFALNLIINFYWVYVFFYKFNYRLGVFVLIFLIIETIAVIIISTKYNFLDGGLLIIYLAWLLFATYLNYQYLELNNKC